MGGFSGPTVAVALACVLLLLWYRLGYWRQATGWRKLPPWLGAVCIVLGLALQFGVPSVDRRDSRIASRLVGFPVTVKCQSVLGAVFDFHRHVAGEVFFAHGVPQHTTYLKRKECRELSSYTAGDQASPSFAEAVAVNTLTHESMHMTGIANEADAECAALQRDAQTAQLLGATRYDGQRLALWVWQAMYPHEPPKYVSSECRPGGALDEHLPYPPWSAPPGW